MKRNILTSGFLAFTLLLVGSCLDTYNPPASQSDVNYLVVDGPLNSNGTTNIKLSRTNAINNAGTSTAEGGASVTIAGDGGSTFELSETSPGTYTLSNATLDITQQYKLVIKTTDRREYASDFVPVKQAPPIDTVYHSVSGEDLKIYLTSHDDQNKTRYYLWKYVETWEYRSAFVSDYIFELGGNVIPRPNGTEMYYCWTTLPSTQIMIGSSAKLAKDVMQDFLLYTIGIDNPRLQFRYSTLVQQFALTKEAYQYWELLKKNTETNGSVFDPQPSQGLTNIHCVTNPNEPVVGYLSAGSFQEARTLIDSRDVPYVHRNTGYEDCVEDTLQLTSLPTFDGHEFITTAYYDRAQLLYYFMASPRCVDCRLKGGTTTKPPYWR